MAPGRRGGTHPAEREGEVLNRCTICGCRLGFIGVQTRKAGEVCWIKWSQCSQCSTYLLSDEEGVILGVTREEPPKTAFRS